jgi:putative ABC transport system substrate-binding protein
MHRLTRTGRLATILLTVLAFFLLNAKLTSSVAQNTPIVIVTSQDTGPYQEVVSGFRRYLEQQRVEGPVLVYSLQNDPAKVKTLLSQTKKEGARLFLTVGSQATHVTLQEAGETPVIACMVVNSEEVQKATNATGVIIDFPIETQLQWLQRFLPERKTIGILYNPKENQEKVAEASKVARALGLKLVARPVETPQSLPDALDSLANDADVLWGFTDKTVLSPQTAEPILLFSFRHRIPFTGLSSSWVKAGALYALDRDYVDLGTQCGEIAVKVLQGVRAGSLPPVAPRKVTYAVNLKTAQHMKVDITPSLLEGAQQVFQ